MSSIKNDLIKKISKIEYGAFTTFDFLDIGNYKSISKGLETLEDNGYLSKARRGVYYKTSYNKTLGIKSPPDINEVAYAIARQNNWIITPSGSQALNSIGISTQVPSQIVYVSNGPYREYELGNLNIIFKHTTSREVSGLNDKLLVSIQALKEIGKDNIKNDDLKKISNFLDDDSKNCIKNGIKTTTWIYEALRRSLCIE